jgi:hypothetical protein
MRNWMKQLGMIVSLVFAVGGPSTALAYPPQCEEVCACDDNCDKPCYYFNYYRTTCGAYGASCVDNCRGSNTQASVSQEPQEQQEAQQAEDVCTEHSQQHTSAES